MKKGTTLTTPENKTFIKEMKDYNGNPYYSFLWNKSEKNKNNDEWEVTERYVVNVMNIALDTKMDIHITEILEAKPKIMKAKNGKDYLNCLIWCNADVIQKSENNNRPTPSVNPYVVKDNNYSSNNFNLNDEDDDLPF